MRGQRRVRFIILALGAAALLMTAAPALATITPVKGGCTGSGQFTPGGFKDAAAASVTIPQKASVVWAGTVVRTPPENPRSVDGFVELSLPVGQKITIGEWPSTGDLVANNGTYTYDVPAVIAGIDMTFYGEHYEEGDLWCKGKVTIQVEGSNPLGLPSIALLVISVVGVSLSIRPRKTGATDIAGYREGDVL